MKQAELKEMSINELKDKLESTQSTLANLNLQHSVSQLENPMKIREARRAVARMQSELRRRELGEGK